MRAQRKHFKNPQLCRKQWTPRPTHTVTEIMQLASCTANCAACDEYQYALSPIARCASNISTSCPNLQVVGDLLGRAQRVKCLRYETMTLTCTRSNALRNDVKICKCSTQQICSRSLLRTTKMTVKTMLHQPRINWSSSDGGGYWSRLSVRTSLEALWRSAAFKGYYESMTTNFPREGVHQQRDLVELRSKHGWPENVFLHTTGNGSLLFLSRKEETALALPMTVNVHVIASEYTFLRFDRREKCRNHSQATLTKRASSTRPQCACEPAVRNWRSRWWRPL